MGKYFVALIITVFVIGIYYLYANKNFREDNPLPSPSPSAISFEQLCEKNHGVWLSRYEECEGLSRAVCESSGFYYSACVSPCRHNPNAGVCIQSCIEVCRFN